MKLQDCLYESTSINGLVGVGSNVFVRSGIPKNNRRGGIHLMTLLAVAVAVAEALGNHQSTMRSCDAHLCFLTMFSKNKNKNQAIF